jgi:hypothetical protein
MEKAGIFVILTEKPASEKFIREINKLYRTQSEDCYILGTALSFSVSQWQQNMKQVVKFLQNVGTFQVEYFWDMR